MIGNNTDINPVEYFKLIRSFHQNPSNRKSSIYAIILYPVKPSLPYNKMLNMAKRKKKLSRYFNLFNHFKYGKKSNYVKSP